ncbi:MAG: arylsulfatase [Rhodothermales bacterium]
MRSFVEKPASISIIALNLLLIFVLGSCRSDHDVAYRSASADRPNIVLIMADDLGYSDIGAYGGEIDTPHLNKLTAEGIQFTQFYNNAKCTESRAALLSGLYHHQSNKFKIANHVTLAEVLKEAGYATMMSGKWHLPGNPVERGFDRYFGFLVGAVNFFTGMHWGGDETPMRLDDQVFEVPEEGFYTTDAFTDYAIEFIDEALQTSDPFFLYLAHNAPHFPLHALPEDIEKYKGRYTAGWDQLRAERYNRMINMGLIDADWPLSDRDGYVPAWDELDAEAQADEAYLMAVYAAMVDRLDQNIGRLMDYLEAQGVADNTIVMFMSDNGGCPYDFNHTPDVPPGPSEGYRTYDSEWANASNTPFRLYKQYSHEGGIATPFIVHWPAGISSVGTRTDQVGHLVDIMPTLVEAAGASYPVAHNGNEVLPLEGISLMPVLRGEALQNRPPIYWEFQGNRAVREGPWKLVAERSKGWELYNVELDRTELNNLMDIEAERASRMAAKYDAWAARTTAKSNAEGQAMEPSTQAR